MILSAKTGALAAAGGLITACTSTNNPSSATSSTGGGGVQISEHVPGPQPVSGGTYGGKMRASFQNAPDSFDAPLGGGTALIGWDVVTEVVFFGSLLAYDGASGGPAPNIAAAMPDVSTDGKTLTFTLRPDVKFHNGRVITADDFKWSWERMLDPTLKSWGASYLSNVVGYQDVRKQKTKILEGVEVVNATTLKVTLAQPDFTILNAMSLPITAPVPREEVARLGDTKFGQTPVGFGPFKIESYDEANQRAVFVKFDEYMYPGLPYIDSVEYHWGVDPSLQMLQLQHGDVDLVGEGVPANQVAATLANPTLKQFVRPFPSPGVRWVTLFQNHPPLDDVRVRQALNWAVDRDALDRVIRDATGFGSPFPGNLGNFPRVFQPYTLDTAKAKQLLSDAGFASGFTLTLTFSNSSPEPEIAQVLQQQLKEVGVAVRLNQVSYSAKFALEAKQEPEMTTDAWYLVQPTAADIVDAVYISSGSSNYNLYSNTQVDTLAKQALAEFDEKTRNEKYAQIEKLIGDDAPGIFLQSLKWNAAVSPKVQNYQYRGETYSYYDRLWF
jgi:ABC-type transport system substrate-binding protein